MRYLITGVGFTPFFSERFDSENHFNSDLKMIVFDFKEKKYTNDGLTWIFLEFDHL